MHSRESLLFPALKSLKFGTVVLQHRDLKNKEFVLKGSLKSYVFFPTILIYAFCLGVVTFLTHIYIILLRA